MKIIDQEPQFWFLFEHEEKLMLDVNCNHGAFGYSYMIILSSDEIENYKINGHNYINEIAREIQYSAPVAKGSKSIYKGRDVSKEYSETFVKTVKEWRENQKAT